MVIGIFDSGKGAWLVKDELERLLPEHKFVVATDTKHVPYGSRAERDIQQLANAALQPLIKQTNLIVIACNSATAAAIDWLRERYPNHIFVGYEPMIKTAAATYQHFCVLATPTTRASNRYRSLKDAWATECTVDEPNTIDWAEKIENNQVLDIKLDEVALAVNSGSGAIILACTHYLALREILQKQFPTVQVIEPTPAVARRIRSLIAD